MGINNRQRRAAKQHKRAHRRADRPGARPARGGGEDLGAGWWLRDERAVADGHIQAAIAAINADRAAARTYARLLTGPGSPAAPAAVTAAVHDLLRQLIVAVVRGGWAPTDLAQLCRRRLAEGHLPALASLLAGEAARHPRERVPAAWRADLDEMGAPSPADPATAEGLELLLGLAATVAVLPVVAPVVPPPGTPPQATAASSSTDSKALARVRALLAKAEATPFAEEAEALSAKAQELITRYTLDRIMDEESTATGADDVGARRLWIDPPYVLAKALLIDAVADANRCRAVVAEQFGFSTVVGEPHDLEAVELLATSLLVQADAAMLRCGSRVGRHGRSSTTSFRRSFLVSYADRIGERLRESAQTATEQTGRSRELVPLLAKRAEHVDAEWHRLFPRTVAKQARISNGEGWAEGRAAADRARLGIDRHQVGAAAG